MAYLYQKMAEKTKKYTFWPAMVATSQAHRLIYVFDSLPPARALIMKREFGIKQKLKTNTNEKDNNIGGFNMLRNKC